MTQNFYVFNIADKNKTLYFWEDRYFPILNVMPDDYGIGSISQGKITAKLSKKNYKVYSEQLGLEALLQTENKYQEGQQVFVRVTHLPRTEKVGRSFNQKPARVADEKSVCVGPVVLERQSTAEKVRYSSRAEKDKVNIELADDESLFLKKGWRRYNDMQLTEIKDYLSERLEAFQAPPFWLSEVVQKGASETVVYATVGLVNTREQELLKTLGLEVVFKTIDHLPSDVKEDISFIWQSKFTISNNVTITYEKSSLGHLYDINANAFNVSAHDIQAIGRFILKHTLLCATGGRLLIDIPFHQQVKKDILYALEEIFSQDYLHTKIKGISNTGLIEMVRPAYFEVSQHLLEETDI